MACRVSLYNFIVCTLCTVLYYLAVRICVQRIMITLLQWQKYSASPATPMELVSVATHRHPPHLKRQWWRSWSVACYLQSTGSALVPSGPVTLTRHTSPARPFKPPPPPSPSEEMGGGLHQRRDMREGLPLLSGMKELSRYDFFSAFAYQCYPCDSWTNWTIFIS